MSRMSFLPFLLRVIPNSLFRMWFGPPFSLRANNKDLFLHTTHTYANKSWNHGFAQDQEATASRFPVVEEEIIDEPKIIHRSSYRVSELLYGQVSIDTSPLFQPTNFVKSFFYLGLGFKKSSNLGNQNKLSPNGESHRN